MSLSSSVLSKKSWQNFLSVQHSFPKKYLLLKECIKLWGQPHWHKSCKVGKRSMMWRGQWSSQGPEEACRVSSMATVDKVRLRVRHRPEIAAMSLLSHIRAEKEKRRLSRAHCPPPPKALTFNKNWNTLCWILSLFVRKPDLRSQIQLEA